jgi:hypothetical protein
MLRKSKESQVWTVRNKVGQYIGSYRAYTAEQAISRFVQAQASTAATFRKSQPLQVNRADFTATVEEAQ